MDPLAVFFLIVVLVGIFAIVIRSAVQKANQRARREEIQRKYGYNELAERIINRQVWVGQTDDQLRDSLGAPADIDEKVMKTKRREIWKYFPKNARSYGLKITVENGVVAGWDEKM
jgi:hypothetical protein